MRTEYCRCFFMVLLIFVAVSCGTNSSVPADSTGQDIADVTPSGDTLPDVQGDLSPSDTSSDVTEPAGVCTLAPEDSDPDFADAIGCRNDYLAVASPPLVASIPGALSAKTVLDQMDGNHLYFQNSRRYPIHWNFASTHLSGNGPCRWFHRWGSSTRPSITRRTAALCWGH